MCYLQSEICEFCFVDKVWIIGLQNTIFIGMETDFSKKIYIYIT